MTSPHNYRLARAACVLAIFAALMGSTAPSPLYPTYISLFGINQLMATAIFAIYALGTLSLLFLSPKLLQHLPSKRGVIVLGLALAASGAIIFGFAYNLPMLLIGRFLNGAGTGAITGIASATLFELAPPRARNSAATIATLAFTIGAAGGPGLTSLMLDLDFRPTTAPFLIIAFIAIAAISGLMLAEWPERGKAVASVGPTKSSELSLPASPTSMASPFRVSCLTLALAWVLGSVLMAIGSTLGLKIFALSSPGIAGLIPALFQLFAGVGQAAWGRADIARSILFGAVGMALAQVVLIVAAPGAHGAVLMVTVPFCGLFYGAAFVGALNLAQRVAPPEARAVYISRFYTVGYLTNATSALSLGMLIDFIGLTSAFYTFSSILVLLALIVSYFALQGRRRWRGI